MKSTEVQNFGVVLHAYRAHAQSLFARDVKLDGMEQSWLAASLLIDWYSSSTQNIVSLSN